MGAAAWKKAVLAALMGVFPAFAQVTVGQAVLVGEPRIALPQGDKLSDAELLEVDGEVAPLAVAARIIVGAGAFATGDLIKQGVEIALGWRSHIDMKEVGLSAAIGAGLSPVLVPATASAEKLVQSALVTGARWTARAAAAVGTASVSLAHRVHDTLHRYVAQPVVNAVKSAWEWLTGR